MPAVFPNRFPAPRGDMPPVGYRGTVACSQGKLLVTDTTAITLFTLPTGARPLLWIWQVESAFNGTSPQVTIAVTGGIDTSVGLTTTNVTATGDKLVFVNPFYLTTDYGIASPAVVTGVFAASGSPTTGAGWLKCLYTMD